jgi:hypothetical protein
MSKPAAFILATNDSISDDIITRKRQLHDKLVEVYKINKKNNVGDPRAVLKDLSSHTLYVREEYKPNVSIAYEYYKTTADGPLPNNLKMPSKIRFDLSKNTGDFLHDMVVRVRFNAVGKPDPVNLTDGSYNRNAIRYRYTEKPGVRLFNKVRLKYNETLVDEYTSRDLLFYDKFRVGVDGLYGWNELVGQENLKEGYYYHRDQRVTQHLAFTNGPQTPQPYQAALDVWVPLIFWFNLLPEQSLISGGIISLQQCVEIELNPLSMIIEAINANDEVVPMDVPFGITTMELYTKNIYLDPEISDLFKNRPSLSLIRVHKQQDVILNAESKSLLINQLKFPLEYMYVGVQPLSNDSSFDTWPYYSERVLEEVSLPATIINPATWPVLQLVSRTGTFYDQVSCLNSLAIVAHTTNLYKDIPLDLFNKYTSWFYDDVYVSGDIGAYFIPFSLKIDQFQPSGYVQLSKIREFRLDYTGNNINRNNRCQMFVSGMALNFLSIDVAGNALLKFAT